MATTHFTNTIVVLNTFIQHLTLAVFLVVHCPYPCHSVTTNGLESVVLCMPCVAIPLLSLLSTPLPFSLTLCVIGSHSVSNTFTSERVTLHTHTSVKKETVWMAHCKQDTLADAHINSLQFKKGFVAVCLFVVMNDTHGMQWRINGDH